MSEPYNRETASPRDRVAWALCQIIDDDAPLRWTRYRGAAACVAMSAEMMQDLSGLHAAMGGTATPTAATSGGVDWRALYRFQTAMRYMDNNGALTKERAFAMADAELVGLEHTALTAALKDGL